MKIKLFVLIALALSSFASSDVRAEARGGHMGVHAKPAVGKWIGSGGLGVTFSPTTFLLNPSFEYIWTPDVYIGPNLQIGFGGGGVIVGISASARYFFVHSGALHPFFEGGLGMAFASNSTGFGSASAVGVLIHVGMGLDYQLSRDLFVGTVIRADIMPPLTNFMLAWPIANVRFVM
jgi:hypothetical protein